MTEIVRYWDEVDRCWIEAERIWSGRDLDDLHRTLGTLEAREQAWQQKESLLATKAETDAQPHGNERVIHKPVKLEARLKMYRGFDLGRSVSGIAKWLGHSPRTVARIKREWEQERARRQPAA